MAAAVGSTSSQWHKGGEHDRRNHEIGFFIIGLEGNSKRETGA